MTAYWETSHWFVFINYLIIAFLLGVLITWYIWRAKVTSLETKIRRNKQELDNQLLLYKELEDQKEGAENNLSQKELELSTVLEENETKTVQLEAELEVVKDQLKKHKSGNKEQSKAIKDYQDKIDALEMSDGKTGKGDEKKIKKLKKEVEALKAELKMKSAIPSSEDIKFDDTNEGKDESISQLASSVAIAIDEEKDDLKKIEGIGPKIEQHLNADGIYTYDKLSETSVAHLQTVLDNAGSHYSMHDPSSWPDQAKLASKGEWHALKSLQDKLQGGRKK